MKRMSKFARRCAALMLAVVLLCMAVPAAFAAEGDTLPAGATTMGGANTTLIPLSYTHLTLPPIYPV